MFSVLFFRIRIIEYYFDSCFQLMRFVQGKIMMALEGGYNLNSLSKSVLACVNTLLGETSNLEKLDEQPFESTWRVICKVIFLYVYLWI